jgi:chloramphenicol-sensitive protein RarD
MQGIFLAILAYSIWGWFPLYFNFLDHVSATEIVVHRIIWSMFATLGLLVLLKRLNLLWRAMQDPATRYWMFAAAVMISINWFVYVWAVTHHHVVDSSLGYFIMPLVSLLLGRIVLKETMNHWQIVAAFLALIAVCWELWHFGRLPWVGVVLSFAFAVYGLIRKLHPIDGVTGLTIETIMLMPFVLLWLAWMTATQPQQLLFFESASNLFLLIGGGVLTAIPLILFVMATQRIDLSLVGFIQYINPTIQFLLGVYVLEEHFPEQRWITFSIVWVALGIFMVGVWRQQSLSKADAG